MNNKVSISIVIPVYNGAAMLGDCLASVCTQAGEVTEIIVVDNNSTDNTQHIIEEFQKEYSNLRYVFEEKRTRGAARNKGIAHVRGDIVVMTDVDCIVPHDWLERITRPIITEGEDVVMGFECDTQNTYVSRNVLLSHKKYLECYREDKYISVFDSKNCALRISVAREITFDDELGNLEDYEFGLRLRDKYRIRFLPEVYVMHKYRTSFAQWLGHSYDRAFWMARIYKKYKGKKEFTNIDFIEALRLKNMIMFPLWSFSLVVREGIFRGLFVFGTELFWRIGLIAGLLAR